MAVPAAGAAPDPAADLVTREPPLQKCMGTLYTPSDLFTHLCKQTQKVDSAAAASTCRLRGDLACRAFMQALWYCQDRRRAVVMARSCVCCLVQGMATFVQQCNPSVTLWRCMSVWRYDCVRPGCPSKSSKGRA